MSTDLILAKITSAKSYLAKARSLQDVQQVIAVADAAKVYAKHVNASIETINQAAEIRLRAERKLGEMLKKSPKNPGVRMSGGSKKEPPKIATLEELGISKKTSSRAQELASIPEADFEKAIVTEPNKELNHNRVVKDIKEKRQKDKRQSDRKEAAAKAEPQFFDNVHVGDFRDHFDKVANGSLSLIFTDPPYDRKSVELFGGLADFAGEKLCEGGSLICYVGQTQIPAAITCLSSRLRYWWTICCLHSGGANLMNEYGIRCGWKAVLWFVKGTRENKEDIVSDVMSGGREKSHHDWQQSQIEAEYWIEHLCQKDGIVCDPFLGGGTTAAAAIKLKRQWIGFEKDHDQAVIAMQRCSQ